MSGAQHVASPAPLRAPWPIARFPWWLSLWILAAAAALITPPLRTAWLSSYGSRWAYILLLSGLISLGLTPLVGRLACWLEIVDLPAARKVHTQPTPLLGGVAVYTGFGISILANSILDAQVVAIMLGASLLVAVSIADDTGGVPAGVKLFAHLAAAAIVIYSGVVLTLFPMSTVGFACNVILTLIWLLGITSAMNFFDGMDGLATGLGIITAGFLGLVAAQTFQPFLGWFAASIVGSCLGFLPFNFRPRRPAAIFLGDTGSTFLGFLLAALAVKGEWAENSVIDVAAPVLIFWVFIFDMTHVTIARIASGKVRSFRQWIDYVGKDHLHHRLATLLGSQRLAVLLIFLLSTGMGLAAVALRNARPLDAGLLILQAAIFVVIVSILERAGNR